MSKYTEWKSMLFTFINLMRTRAFSNSRLGLFSNTQAGLFSACSRLSDSGRKKMGRAKRKCAGTGGCCGPLFTQIRIPTRCFFARPECFSSYPHYLRTWDRLCLSVLSLDKIQNGFQFFHILFRPDILTSHNVKMMMSFNQK